jgi:hypothetical protein
MQQIRQPPSRLRVRNVQYSLNGIGHNILRVCAPLCASYALHHETPRTIVSLKQIEVVRHDAHHSCDYGSEVCHFTGFIKRFNTSGEGEIPKTISVGV